MFTPAPRIDFATAADGYQFALRRWDNAQPAAHVVCLHGIISHGGWYIKSLAHLADNGFAVHMLERRGSGLNTVSRGDVDDWQTWLKDVEDYLESLPSDVPRLLLGISWGGILATAIARHRSDLLSGVGLICPGLVSRQVGKFWQKAALRLANLVGLQRMEVNVPLRDPALFTDSPTEQNYIAADALALRRITIRFAFNNLRLTAYATSRPEAIRLPTLLILGGRDRIMVNSEIRALVDRIDHQDRRVIEYPAAAHTLEFEPDPAQYFHDLCAWCHDVARPRQKNTLVVP